MRAGLAIGLILLACLMAAPAGAGPAQSPGVGRSGDPMASWAPWQLALAKTATYRVLASVDLIVGGYLLTGSEIETAAIVGVVAGAKSIVYYLHEMLWTYHGPTPDEMNAVDRSLAKSATYRLTSVSLVFALSHYFTDSIEMSVAVAAVDAIYGIGVYFLHEMLWHQYGPAVLHPGTGPFSAPAFP
ncbi:MAG: DUF2061 domain-containing protein [Rhodospirillaceae bacterium]